MKYTYLSETTSAGGSLGKVCRVSAVICGSCVSAAAGWSGRVEAACLYTNTRIHRAEVLLYSLYFL